MWLFEDWGLMDFVYVQLSISAMLLGLSIYFIYMGHYGFAIIDALVSSFNYYHARNNYHYIKGELSMPLEILTVAEHLKGVRK